MKLTELPAATHISTNRTTYLPNTMHSVASSPSEESRDSDKGRQHWNLEKMTYHSTEFGRQSITTEARQLPSPVHTPNLPLVFSLIGGRRKRTCILCVAIRWFLDLRVRDPTCQPRGESRTRTSSENGHPTDDTPDTDHTTLSLRRCGRS